MAAAAADTPEVPEGVVLLLVLLPVALASRLRFAAGPPPPVEGGPREEGPAGCFLLAVDVDVGGGALPRGKLSGAMAFVLRMAHEDTYLVGASCACACARCGEGIGGK